MTKAGPFFIIASLLLFSSCAFSNRSRFPASETNNDVHLSTDAQSSEAMAPAQMDPYKLPPHGDVESLISKKCGDISVPRFGSMSDLPQFSGSSEQMVQDIMLRFSKAPNGITVDAAKLPENSLGELIAAIFGGRNFIFTGPNGKPVRQFAALKVWMSDLKPEALKAVHDLVVQSVSYKNDPSTLEKVKTALFIKKEISSEYRAGLIGSLMGLYANFLQKTPSETAGVLGKLQNAVRMGCYSQGQYDKVKMIVDGNPKLLTPMSSSKEIALMIGKVICVTCAQSDEDFMRKRKESDAYDKLAELAELHIK